MDAGDGKSVELIAGLWLPASAVRLRFDRAGGPGGQHVNKTATRATLTVHLDDLTSLLNDAAMDRFRRLAGARLAAEPERVVISAANSRSQDTNRRAALARLGGLIRDARRQPKRRRPTRPSAAAKRRRLDSKKRRSRVKALRGRVSGRDD